MSSRGSPSSLVVCGIQVPSGCRCQTLCGRRRPCQQRLDLTDVCWIGDGDKHFHAAVEVAHQVRGADTD